jgi:hypothetical protein
MQIFPDDSAPKKDNLFPPWREKEVGGHRRSDEYGPEKSKD